MKLYTEEQVRKAIVIGCNWGHLKNLPSNDLIDIFIDELTPIVLPTEEEIGKTAKEKHIGLSRDVANYRGCFEQGAKWVINKIKGGDQ